MTITYNAAERAFRFRDKLTLRYRLLYLMMITLVVSAGVNLYRALPTGIGWDEFGDLFVLEAAGIVLTVALRKTGREHVPVEEIEGLQVKTILGNRRYALRLKNGKVRDVLGVNSQVKENRLQRLLAEAGIH